MRCLTPIPERVHWQDDEFLVIGHRSDIDHYPEIVQALRRLYHDGPTPEARREAERVLGIT